MANFGGGIPQFFEVNIFKKFSCINTAYIIKLVN